MDKDIIEAVKKELRSTLEEIRDRERHDFEVDHADADDALLNFIRAFGCTHEADIWESIGKWYA